MRLGCANNTHVSMTMGAQAPRSKTVTSYKHIMRCCWILAVSSSLAVVGCQNSETKDASTGAGVTDVAPVISMSRRPEGNLLRTRLLPSSLRSHHCRLYYPRLRFAERQSRWTNPTLKNPWESRGHPFSLPMVRQIWHSADESQPAIQLPRRENWILLPMAPRKHRTSAISNCGRVLSGSKSIWVTARPSTPSSSGITMRMRVYRDVIVQVSDDPDFLTAHTVFNNDYDNSSGLGIGFDMGYVETSEGKLIDCKGVEARYVRLFTNGNHIDDKNHFTEVEVFGGPEA